MMNFVPLMKADAAQRLVYGFIDETPDRAGEVLDYATAKPAFESWSAEFAKATGGKSLGNIRAQHDLKKAAGKLVELTFDDTAKSISFVAHIVDDAEWKKVEEGVYTGFSPGGRYAKRWQDGAHKRYTPVVGELSIVDLPCIPSGAFTMTKADGTEEQVEFVLSKAYEPGNDATKARADDLAKAAGNHAKAKDFVVQARADLIAENATAELQKMATGEDEPVIDPVAAMDAALAKAAAVIAPASEATMLVIDAPEQFSDLAKAAAAMRLISAGDDVLAKGLYAVRNAADLLQQFSYLQTELCYEAKSEGDGSPLPAKAADIVKQIGALVIAMAQEEVAELIASMPDTDPVVVILDGDEMALATSIIDLVKADADLMEKAGKRNSKKDQASIQSMHDNAVALGATCDADANKAALLAAEGQRDRLAKAFDSALPRVEALTKSLETTDGELKKAVARIAELEAQPAAPKGAVFTIEKAEDGGALGKSADIAALPAGADRTAAINAAAREVLAKR